MHHESTHTTPELFGGLVAAWIGHAGRSRNIRLRTDTLGEFHQSTTAGHSHIAMVRIGCRCRPRAEEPWTCGGSRCCECVKAQVADPLPAWSRCAHECAQGGSSLVVGATLTTCAHARQIDGRAVVEPFHFALEFHNQILPFVERRLQACCGRVAYVLLQWRLVNTVRGPA